MIKLTPDEAERVLVVELHGMVSEDDYDQAMEQLERRYPQWPLLGRRTEADHRRRRIHRCPDLLHPA